MQTRIDTQFTATSKIVQHTGCYTGKMGEVSFDKTKKQLLIHNGCTPGGVAYAQLEDTPCAFKGEK